MLCFDEVGLVSLPLLCLAHLEILFKVAPNYIWLAISAGVIYDNGNKWEVGLLHAEPVHCILDVGSMIIGHTLNGNQWIMFHFIIFSYTIIDKGFV